MDLFSSIPPWVWAIAAIGFAFWYTFKRGGNKKATRKSLNRLRREKEAENLRLNITRTREAREGIEQKAKERRRKDGGF